MSFTLFRNQDNKWIKTSNKILRSVTGDLGGGGGGGDGGGESEIPETLVVRIYDGVTLLHTETISKNPEGMWWAGSGSDDGYGIVYIFEHQTWFPSGVTGWGLTLIGTYTGDFAHTTGDNSTPYLGDYTDIDNGTTIATVGVI